MSKRRTPFGDLLRHLRSAAALSQEALAEGSGLSKRGISDLERGARLAPRLETVRLLAEALALGDAERQALLAAARPPGTVVASATPVGTSPLVSLPLPPTRLIGREAEMATLSNLLAQEDVRLVTLTGPGGTGKTHLALAVAASALGHYPDGVVFVDLSPLTDPALVVSTIAALLGVREIVGESVRETVSRYLRDRRLLLVLDNCEQVLESASDIAALVAGCPHLAILATSREPLHIRAEREIAVSPLPFPDPARLPPLAELRHVPAVALFVERAHAASASFALTGENAPAVAAICRRLDGLPLAIELAAARDKVLPPVALLARLDHRLPLLGGGGRDLPARQRTMRAAIAWSYDLLTAEEQTLFRLLAVFAGGFTLAAVSDIAGGPAGRGSDRLEGVSSLLDKSLLRRADGPAGEPRFTLLETVREFAREQLAASGEEHAIRDRHAAWFLALAEEAGRNLGPGQSQLPWLARLDADLANLRGALVWFDETGQHSQILRLMVAIDAYWGVRPYQAEVLRWLGIGLHADPGTVPELRALAALAHCLASYMTYDLGDQPVTIAHAEEAIALAEACGDPLVLGQAHYVASLAWNEIGETTRAASSSDTALSLFREHGTPFWIATVLAEVGSHRLGRGDIAGAVPMLDEALDILRDLGSSWSLTPTMGHRGHAALLLGDPVLAANLFAESIVVAELMDDVRHNLGAVAGLAGVALALGQPERAARLLGAVDAMKEASGIRRPSLAPHSERITREVQGQLTEPEFTAAWNEGRALRFADAIADGLTLASSVGAQEPAHDGGPRITARELDVLRLLAQGNSDKEIAATLFIGTRTVQTHVGNLFAKLGVNSRAEAAAVAVRRGLV